jgi:hypothetical protein
LLQGDDVACEKVIGIVFVLAGEVGVFPKCIDEVFGPVSERALRLPATTGKSMMDQDGLPLTFGLPGHRIPSTMRIDDSVSRRR